MRRSLLLLAALALPFVAPASAALKEGAYAPGFTAKGAVAGTETTVNLAASLKDGPVVLYFFPAAFTGGCNAEAHAFAEAMPDFKKAGASVIGMTAGNVDKLKAFSAEHCAGTFPVAAASASLIASYDVSLMKDGAATGVTDRTSYVIAPDGKILKTYTNMDFGDHVKVTLDVVRKWRAAHPRWRG